MNLILFRFKKDAIKKILDAHIMLC